MPLIDRAVKELLLTWHSTADEPDDNDDDEAGDGGDGADEQDEEDEEDAENDEDEDGLGDGTKDDEGGGKSDLMDLDLTGERATYGRKTLPPELLEEYTRSSMKRPPPDVLESSKTKAARHDTEDTSGLTGMDEDELAEEEAPRPPKRGKELTVVQMQMALQEKGMTKKDFGKHSRKKADMIKFYDEAMGFNSKSAE